MKQKIIILEGADMSGKSTIAKALSARLGIPTFKPNRPNRNWDPDVNLKYLTEGVTQFIEQSGSSVILDRWHPSDFMYNRLFKREHNDMKVFDIDTRLSVLNTLIVYCYKDETAYLPDDVDADMVNPTMYKEMETLYRAFDGSSYCRSLWINTSDEDLEKQLGLIIELL